MPRVRLTKPADDINTEDTEGHSMHWSDAEVKHDVTPIGASDADDPAEDTEE
jgi:hypothetical protein